MARSSIGELHDGFKRTEKGQNRLKIVWTRSTLTITQEWDEHDRPSHVFLTPGCRIDKIEKERERKRKQKTSSVCRAIHFEY
jgi:hypothetical protein